MTSPDDLAAYVAEVQRHAFTPPDDALVGTYAGSDDRGPADDCGVRGGCGACPLFAANVCGDPAPDPLAAGDYPRGWTVDHVRPLAEAGDLCNLVPSPSAPRTGPLCGSCDAGLPMGCACPPPARFEVNGAGVVTDRASTEWAFREYTRPWAEEVARRAAEFGKAWAEVFAVAEAAGVLVDPDAPDVDPAEPRPDGAGCCGGGCGG
ncbi:hypothetical protein CA850_29645 [Micromonospora echinospora]|uniref:Uncharacterized protein n=1 Tax=Micromonospora echinospora TaxID=1877 RepID=A0A1C5ABN6_MICEC|nr:hypothetical protein [Micromonospora echinospora]OZV74744.1 hypothetical protein CA850_29645 [Micromonospora echinospora]SCF42526.1 hypothetical protein GA0070618_6672 [Micromonospora echinospora]